MPLFVAFRSATGIPRGTKGDTRAPHVLAASISGRPHRPVPGAAASARCRHVDPSGHAEAERARPAIVPADGGAAQRGDPARHAFLDRPRKRARRLSAPLSQHDPRRRIHGPHRRDLWRAGTLLSTRIAAATAVPQPDVPADPAIRLRRRHHRGLDLHPRHDRSAKADADDLRPWGRRRLGIVPRYRPRFACHGLDALLHRVARWSAEGMDGSPAAGPAGAGAVPAFAADEPAHARPAIDARFRSVDHQGAALEPRSDRQRVLRRARRSDRESSEERAVVARSGSPPASSSAATSSK